MDEFGLCVAKCGTNEVFDSSIHQCTCVAGLGRVNGACQICPAGSKPTSSGDACSFCKANEELVGGRCVCKSGYAYNSAQTCTICSELDNGFMINGVCSKCPGNKVFDGKGSCTCPAGKVQKSASFCVSQCKND